eukprot:587973_1
MSQQEITLPKKKFSQLCMNVMETFKSMQEIMGADHLNESHDEDHDEFIERNILSQMTTCEIDSLRSGLHTASLVHVLHIISTKPPFIPYLKTSIYLSKSNCNWYHDDRTHIELTTPYMLQRKCYFLMK